MHPPFRPDYGSRYTWIGNTLVEGPESGGAISREESSEDWWYSHCNLYDENGQQIGYAAAGYNKARNWFPLDETGCFGYVPGNTPGWNELETLEERKGQPRCWLARYDMNGQQLWCRSYLIGTFYDVAQDIDGNIVAAGEVGAPRKGTSAQGPYTSLPYNPGVGLSQDISGIDCDDSPGGGLPPYGEIGLKGYMVKVDLDANLIWQNAYGNPPDAYTAWGQTSRIWSLAPMMLPGGQGSGFYVAMDAGGQMYMRVRGSDGHVVDRANIPGVQPNAGMRTLSVRTKVINGLTHAVLAGTTYPNGKQGAFVAHVEDAESAPFTISQSWTTADPWFAQTHSSALHQFSTNATLVDDQGVIGIAWPVLSDYEITTETYSGRSIADLRVYRLSLNNSVPDWVSPLGEVRAYDLQAGVIQTSDGNLAIVSSSWPDPYSISNAFGYSDLSGTLQTCLEQFNHDWPNTNQYDYWSTDTYVNKLSLADGSIMWKTKFDSEPGDEGTCFPGDIRKQECMYRITESADGGLVVSGNTSHNFDDAYLVKLLPDCQSRIDYDFTVMEALSDDTHTYTLQGDETWNSDKNIVGTILIPDGITLTISNCTIRFADTEQLAWPTRIVVERGGKLIVEDATLTSIDECPNSLWDGIELRGNYFAQQTQANQGYLDLNNSTISNARTGVFTARGDFNDPLGAIIKESTGGIVSAQDSRFLNNIHDVVFRPFENRLSNGDVIPNVSIFKRCDFVTDGGIPVEGLYPNSHVAMEGVRGIPFRGCSWRNTLLGQQLEMPYHQGAGISNNSSSFTVADDCASLVPLGTPCPPQDVTTSSFTNLHRGILAVTYKTDRTFSVDNATFTGTNFGIRMEGAQDASITRCSFDVPTPFTPGIVGATYGVYSDQCTGYRIQENSFRTTQPGAPRKVGLVIKDSGPDYNTFYNNTFDNLYTGSIIQGQNAGEDDALGLEVKCNDYGLADANFFDNALTGGDVRVQKTQGGPINNPLDQTEWKNPAGNRFSLDHTGAGDPEEDWHVQVTATVVEYFHHFPTATDRTKPNYADNPIEIITSDQLVGWTSKEQHCPSLLDDGGKEVKRLLAEGEHADYESSKDAYDATKDNGDTYSLLGYVDDPTKSSTQVRNALQSVAPKVSLDVWQAAFERSPAMSAWHITQALLSNSPLQTEALLMVDDYGLPAGYASLVHAAQNGLNVLTLLESAMAKHGGNKAEALADLGRMSWLDEEDLAASLDALLALHGELPAENHALAVSGVLTAKGDYSALETLALAEESASDSPERYTLLKRYAQLEQQEGLAEPDEALRTWLANLGQQRDVQGSTWANAWLHALGEELPEEVIVLPETGPKSASRALQVQPVQWHDDELLEVFPNPARNAAYVAFDLGGSDQAQLRVLDVHGRQLSSFVLSGNQGIATIPLDGLGSGLYLIEVLRPDQPSQQARLVVQ
ncbi:MAG: T9SS type A sorting domain-containing protein [Flavobacteriales bacterium]|nr:T9SS type A sorting domain-containing protein [Flavobacteriales bacterium]